MGESVEYIIFEVSKVALFLIPFYMRIFLGDKKKTIIHMVSWLTVLGGMALIEKLIVNQGEENVLLAFVLAFLFFIFVYIFEIRGIYKEISIDKVKDFAKLRYFKTVLMVCLTFIGVVVAVDFCMMFFILDISLFAKVFGSVFVIFGFIQSIWYGMEYLRLRESV